MSGYQFFQNRSCEYFPCHKGIPQEAFNCLFCYCPLYALGRDCGGNCSYSKRGYKSCINCTFPHVAQHYPLVMERCKRILEKVKQMDGEDR